MAATPYLVHIGLPKTGTSSLQAGLFATHPQIRYLGKPWWDETAGLDASLAAHRLVDSLWQEDTFAFDWDVARRRFDTGIAPRAEGKTCVLISEEGLSAALAADRWVTARRLRAFFGEARILITVRNQLDALHSLYRWFHTRGLVDGSADRWIARCRAYDDYRGEIADYPLRQYRYAALYACYRDLFGAGRVLVLPFEWMIREPERFAHEFARFAGVDPGTTLACLRDQPHENRSPGMLGAAYQRALKRGRRLTRRTIRSSLDLKTQLRFDSGINRAINRALDAVDRPHRGFGAATLGFLRDYYGPDNLSFAEAAGLDVAALGYPLPNESAGTDGT